MGSKSGKLIHDEMVTSLQETKEILDAIISSSYDAIVAIDTDKRIIEFNHQAETLTGYPLSEMKGQQVEQLYENKAIAGEIYQAIQEFTKIDRTDITLLHKDGSRIPISLSGRLIVGASGEILGQVGFIKDLREIQLLEARLKALIDSSKAINSTFDLQIILDNVIRSALLAVPVADRGSIHLFDDRTRRLEMKISSVDFSRKAWEEQSFRIGEGIAGWVFEQQEPAIAGDVVADPRYQPRGEARIKPPPSMVCVPITSKQRPLGVMTLSNTKKLDAFLPRDFDFLTSFADQAATAIENSAQMSKIKKEAEDLDFLRGVSLRINARMTYQEILASVLESGNRLLGTEMAVAHWRGKASRTLKPSWCPGNYRI